MKPNTNMALSNDEHAMIFSHNFGISFAPKGQGSAPSNDYDQILFCAVQMASAFLFAMLGMILPMPWNLICFAFVFCILFFRFATVAIFFAAVLKGRYTNQFYRSALYFWGWWPMWIMVTTLGATIIGYSVGDWLWKSNLGPYFNLKKLQKYTDINPEHVPGERIQDAGLVEFTNFAEMDRGKGGCYMNKGDTYCVAPIVNGGQVAYGMSGLPRTGSYDFFAVGVNCCSCPNRDMRCGAWDNPIASGGLRSLDEKSRPFFKLALDDWQASYQKTAKNPLFFEWVQDAEWSWKGMWNRALNVGFMAAACGVSLALCIAYLLDKLLQILWLHEIVAPRSCFAPVYGLDGLTQLLLPKMYYRYQQEQQEIAKMPLGEDWKPQRGPGAEDNNLKQDYGATEGSLQSQMFQAAMTPPGMDAGSTPAPLSNYGIR